MLIWLAKKRTTMQDAKQKKKALRGITVLTTCLTVLQKTGPYHVVQPIPFFMHFKALRRRENGSKLSLGRIANSISRRADAAFAHSNIHLCLRLC